MAVPFARCHRDHTRVGSRDRPSRFPEPLVTEPKPQPDARITPEAHAAALQSNGLTPRAADDSWTACAAPEVLSVVDADGRSRPCEYAPATDASPPYDELRAALQDGELRASPCAACARCVEAGTAKLAPFVACYGSLTSAGSDAKQTEVVRLPRSDGAPPRLLATGTDLLVLEESRPLAEGAAEWAPLLADAPEQTGIELRAHRIGNVDALQRHLDGLDINRIELTWTDEFELELREARRAADALGAELQGRLVLTPQSWHRFEAAAAAAAAADTTLRVEVIDRGGAVPLAALTPEELLVVKDAVTSAWERFQEHTAPSSLTADAFDALGVALRGLLGRCCEQALEADVAPGGSLSLPDLDHPWFDGDGHWWIEQLFGHSHLPCVQSWIASLSGEGALDGALPRNSWMRVLCHKLAWEQRDPTLLATLRALYADQGNAQQLIEAERAFCASFDTSPFGGPWAQLIGLPRPERTQPISLDQPAPQPADGPARITVLIPSYKHERYIADTIRSALQQRGVALRVLVVDDRSPDRTAELARGIEDDRVEVRVNRENLGLGNSVLQALETIDTPYVALLNSDDLFHPERLARCVAMLDADDAAQVVTTDLHLIDEDGGELTPDNVSLATDGLQVFNWVTWYERSRIRGDLPREQVFEQLLERNFLATSSNLTARTEWLRAKHASFQNLKYCLDWQVFLEAAVEGALVHIAEPLAGYRLHATNTVWFPEEKQWEFYLEVSRVIAESLQYHLSRGGELDEAGLARLVTAISAHAANNRETDGLAILLNAVVDGLALDRVAASSAPVQQLLARMREAAAAAVKARDKALAAPASDELDEARRQLLTHVRREQLLHDRELKERRAQLLTLRLEELREQEGARREQVQQRLQESRARCQELTANAAELRARLQSLHDKSSAAREEGRKARESLESRLQQVHATLTQVRAEAKEQVDTLRARIQDLRDKADAVRADLKRDLKRERDALGEVRQRIASVREELKQSRSQVADRNRSITTLSARAKQAAAAQAQLQDEFARHRASSEDAITKLTARRDRLLRESNQLRDEMRTLRASREFRTGNFIWNRLPLSYMSRRGKKWYNRLVDAKNRISLWASGKRRRPQAEGVAVVASCWHWPIYSHTFVYQEMLALTDMGLDLKMIHWAANDLDQLQPAFSYLKDNRVQIKSNMKQHRGDKEHFEKTRPGRLEALIEKLSVATGRTAEDLNEEPLLLRACTFARHAELAGASYLHSYFFYDQSFMVLVASWLLEIPRGVSCYADHMMDDYPLKVVALQLQHADVIVATSARIKEELVGIGGPEVADKIVVKPNGVNGERFEAIDRGLRAPDDPFEVLSISRLEPKKGLEYLIEATAELKKRGRKLKVHLIGAVDTSIQASIDYGAELEDQIKQLGLEEEVILHGMMMHEQIQPIMQRCRAFVAPYVELESGDKDGIPTAMLEALASGLPIVTTDSGSILEVVQDGVQALVTPQRDSAAYGEALDRLITDPQLERSLAQAARKRFDQEFDIKVTERRLHERVAAALQDKAAAAR